MPRSPNPEHQVEVSRLVPETQEEMRRALIDAQEGFRPTKSLSGAEYDDALAAMRPNCCHENARAFCAAVEGFRPVVGWLADHPSHYLRFVAHSVVADAEGGLYEVTPGAGGRVFLPHPYDTEHFRAHQVVWSDLMCWPNGESIIWTDFSGLAEPDGPATSGW